MGSHRNIVTLVLLKMHMSMPEDVAVRHVGSKEYGTMNAIALIARRVRTARTLRRAWGHVELPAREGATITGASANT
jgi:hypothetical protein